MESVRLNWIDAGFVPSIMAVILRGRKEERAGYVHNTNRGSTPIVSCHSPQESDITPTCSMAKSQGCAAHDLTILLQPVACLAAIKDFCSLVAFSEIGWESGNEEKS